jgi:hypothetical protein
MYRSAVRLTVTAALRGLGIGSALRGREGDWGWGYCLDWRGRLGKRVLDIGDIQPMSSSRTWTQAIGNSDGKLELFSHEQHKVVDPARIVYIISAILRQFCIVTCRKGTGMSTSDSGQPQSQVSNAIRFSRKS